MVSPPPSVVPGRLFFSHYIYSMSKDYHGTGAGAEERGRR